MRRRRARLAAVGEDQRWRFVPVADVDCCFGRAEGNLHGAAEQQRRRVRCNLTQGADVIAGVIFK